MVSEGYQHSLNGSSCAVNKKNVLGMGQGCWRHLVIGKHASPLVFLKVKLASLILISSVKETLNGYEYI